MAGAVADHGVTWGGGRCIHMGHGSWVKRVAKGSDELAGVDEGDHSLFGVQTRGTRMRTRATRPAHGAADS
jgi:hypothetical protein